jgi:RNA polymerase sigma factor (sigma-70 family)
MRPRQTLVELFSTFLEFHNETAQRWIVDPRLRRNLESHRLEQDRLEPEQPPEARSAALWSIYWHRAWQDQSHPLASAHLTAYLQEPCYWSAQQVFNQLKTNHSVADFFQTAIARTDKVLKNFDSHLGASLKTYAKVVFDGVIKNWLREQREFQISSDWAILNNVSQKRLIDALQAFGTSSDTIARYTLACTCFKELYAPQPSTARKLAKPDADTWQAIATLYNQERLSQGIQPEGSAASLETWLLHCAKVIRSFQNPTQVSLNTSISSDSDADERLDQLSDGIQDSLLTELIDQEETDEKLAQRQQLGNLLGEAIAQLDAPSRALLQAYYQQQLTQQQIAQQLDLKQYTVSRQLTRLRQNLLLALAKWSQQTLHITLTPNVLDSMSHTLEEWLTAHYQTHA